MINKLITAIAQELYKEFGEEYTIYSEQIKQDFQKPCFYIKPLEPMQEQGFNTIKKRINKFDVHFFPVENESENYQMSEVYERLLQCLEYITIEGKLFRGIKLSSTMQDEVLHFFVNYDFYVMPSQNKTYMDTLYQKNNKKCV